MTEPASSNFIRTLITEDVQVGKHQGQVVTRFPPEPNGYLHIGHAKSICLNFGMAKDFSGICHLRFDDTNPEKEEMEYVKSIQADVEWLGFAWHDKLFHASDYFDDLYRHAVTLIKDGKAYVCSLSAEEMRAHRGTLTEPGKNCAYRNRSVEENLTLFEQMRDGAFAEGEHVLRARIDMASGNINMRDPVMYRIKHAVHPATGDKWHIYPMYDFAHALSDAIEGITHSLCTLEFEDHRPLYNWYLEALNFPHRPQQIEFARLNLNYTVMSKRKLKRLVEENYVSGWNDPRMLTIAGLRRRGYTAAAIRDFCERIGITKRQTIVDMGVLENCVRSALEDVPRAFCVLNPIKVIITDYDKEGETLKGLVHPKKPEFGERDLPFGREIYIDASDFMEDPPKKYFRLAPGKEVRLRYGYVIKCEKVVKDEQGQVTELHCTHAPETLAGQPPADGRKVKGIIHWLAAEGAEKAEVRLYDRLFASEAPGDDFIAELNPTSLEVASHALVEASLREANVGDAFQFERLGYFNVDETSRQERLVFNRTVTLRDSWAKQQKG